MVGAAPGKRLPGLRSRRGAAQSRGIPAAAVLAYEVLVGGACGAVMHTRLDAPTISVVAGTSMLPRPL
ncbi:hypothetical protein NDU88_003357 [Pleurodeles waltl]|uniref:Uncharacterized protein n=1 Tax=Pleurodeles waltl TaxID=8319 RepID=A0AAV7UY88_PLEWA|nr:hypothetical protein NDU88_003357 [Pleurodeles waltl]